MFIHCIIILPICTTPAIRIAMLPRDVIILVYYQCITTPTKVTTQHFPRHSTQTLHQLENARCFTVLSHLKKIVFKENRVQCCV